MPAFMAIGKSEGLAGYWRGNTPQVASVAVFRDDVVRVRFL